MTARLVVADDSTLLREGLVGLLERQGFEVVAQEARADALLDRLASLEAEGALPDAVITASHPGANPPQTLLPVFRGSLDPDVSYFGFSIPLAQADQYAISIAEQPSAPRFGFEVGEAPPGVTHAPATDATAAAQAGRLRQLPARITIPITVLMREPEP